MLKRDITYKVRLVLVVGDRTLDCTDVVAPFDIVALFDIVAVMVKLRGASEICHKEKTRST